MRCRSWRPTEAGLKSAKVSSTDRLVPSRRDWTRCRNKVEPGQVRCSECVELLARHASNQVRRDLTDEQALARDLLERMVGDPDFLVSTRAGQRLGRDATS